MLHISLTACAKRAAEMQAYCLVLMHPLSLLAGLVSAANVFVFVHLIGGYQVFM